MQKRWKLYQQKSKDLIKQILINRKIPKENWKTFLAPNYEKDFHNPFLLPDMDKAVERFIAALKEKEKIAIFGDFDADGIPGAVLFYNFCQFFKLPCEVFIPDREEGYGLNKNAVEEIYRQGIKLLVTIDCGITNLTEICLAQRMGIDVIILDHHEEGKRLPQALAIIDAKRSDSKYPFRELCATGIVFKFIQAITKKLKKPGQNQLKWWLDLVGLATIADIVPLVDENRILAKYGLIVLQKTKNLGLKTLYKIANIVAENINPYTVSFQIAPRINAPGRMDHANLSFYLLTNQNKEEAENLALKINRLNENRQTRLGKILKEAQAKVEKGKLHQKKVIMVEGENWPSGMIGLVAGKLCEQFARPALVLSKGKDFSKGSARSIDGFHIVEALEGAKEYLQKFGGHARAAGFALENRHLDNLYNRLLEVAESKLKDEDLVPRISVDAKIGAENLNLDFYEDIKKLEPFGMGNPRPVFLLEKAKILDIKTMGQKNQHLRLWLEKDNKNIGAVGFDMSGFAQNLSYNKLIDLVFTLDEDNWNGRRRLDLKLLDLKNS
jgi:single-stranded-DNA-specific exonuclease